MSEGLATRRFSVFAKLTPAETRALEDLAGTPTPLGRKKLIRKQGDADPGLFLLHGGWVGSSIDFADGGRQMFKVHLAGDLMGAPSLPLTAAADTLTALTDITYSCVSKHALAELFGRQPRLAMLFFLAAQEERLMLMERLAAVGRLSAVQRIAGLILHLHERLRLIDPAMPPAFELPLTQEQLGDLVGLTPIHVNRVLRDLEQAGCIERDRKRLAILRPVELADLAALPKRAIATDPSWLPAACHAPTIVPDPG